MTAPTASVTRAGRTVHLHCGCGAQVNTVKHLNALPAAAFAYFYSLPVCNPCWDLGKRPVR